MNELAAQKDELLAITAIFENDEILMVDEECRRGVFLASPAIPSPPMKVTYRLPPADPVNGQKSTSPITFPIEFLSPIEFQFELPDDYPSTSPPKFMLVCDWLSRAALSRICGRLDRLWQETRGEILYLWFNFLLYESLSFLNIEQTLDITKKISQPPIEKRYPFQSSRNAQTKNGTHKKSPNQNGSQLSGDKQSSTSGITQNGSVNKQSKVSSFQRYRQRLHNTRGIKYFDQRVRSPNLGIQLIEILKRYDSDQRKETFANTFLVCSICFDNFVGAEMVSFGCDHYYCKNCTKSYCETQIECGQVNSMVCPSGNCDNQADPILVEKLVKPELFKKYDKMLLNSAIGELGAVYCPQRRCQKPIIPDQRTGNEEKLVLCPYCDFAFCSSCKYSFHGVSPCKDFADESEKLIVLEEYENGNASQKSQLEKEYGKQFLIQQLNDHRDRLWLKERSKQCPKCRFSIEKIDGCNKIHCFRCNANFCWLCLHLITSRNPYLHFRDKKSPCFAKLFEGVIQDDEEEDEEWEEVDDLVLLLQE